MSGKRVVKRPKKFSDSKDPELQNATRKAPYVKVLFKDDQEEEIFDSLLTDQLLDIDTDEPLRFEELTVGMEVAALWKENNHYAADIVELYNGHDVETYEKERTTDRDKCRLQSAGKGKQTEGKKKNVGWQKKSKTTAATKSSPKKKQTSHEKSDGGKTSDEVLEVVKLKKKEILAAKNQQKLAQAAAAQIMATSLFKNQNLKSPACSGKKAKSSSTEPVLDTIEISSEVDYQDFQHQKSKQSTLDTPLGKSTTEHPVQSTPDTALGISTTEQPVQSTDTPLGKSTTRQPVQSTDTPLGKSTTRQPVQSTDTPLGKSTTRQPVQSTDTPLGKSTTRQPVQSTDTPLHDSTTEQPFQSILTRDTLLCGSTTEPVPRIPENNSSERPATSPEFQPLQTATSKENSAFMYARGAFSNFTGPFEFPVHYPHLMTNDPLYIPPPHISWNAYQQPMYSAVNNQEYRFPPSPIRYPIPMWNNRSSVSTATATATAGSKELVQQNSPSLLDISNYTPGADSETGKEDSTDIMDTASNTSNHFSTSMNLLAGDSSDEESIAPSSVSSITSESVPSNMSAACPQDRESECADCLRKDKQIVDLKRKIHEMENAGQSGQVEEDKNRSLSKKQHKPKTRPEIEFAEHIILHENQEPPPEFQRLAPGAKIAVKPLWLHSILSTLKRKRARKQKKADKKGLTVPDENIEILKRLVDGFYDPWDLVKGGGTSAFRDDPVFQSLGLYAQHELKLGSTAFTRAWNTKMASARQLLKKIQKKKEESTNKIEGSTTDKGDSTKKKESAKEKEEGSVNKKKRNNNEEKNII